MPSASRSSTLALKISYYLYVILVCAGVCASIYFLFKPLLAAVLLFFLLEPVVNMLETKGLDRLWAVIALYSGFFILLGALLYFVFPLIVTEAQNLLAHMPQYKMTLQQSLAELQTVLHNRFPQATIPDLYALLASFAESHLAIDFEKTLGYISSLFSVLSVVVIVPIITFFLLLESHLLKKSCLLVLPNRYFEMFVLLISKTTQSIQNFIRGQLLDAAAVGVLTAVGLAVIGLPYFIVIGIVAGVGNLIPYLGPIIGFVPAFIVALVSDGGIESATLIKLCIVFASVQFIEGTFVYPFAVGGSVNLHPAVVIIGITIGGQVAGVLGMIVAIPVISIVKVTIAVLHTSLKRYSVI